MLQSFMIKKNIHKYCRKAGTTQAAVARQMGMTRQRLSRIVNDPYRLGIGYLDDISVILECSRADLLGYDGECQLKLNKIKEVIK